MYVMKNTIIQKSAIKRFLNDESGSSVVEYGLLAGLIATVIVAGTTSLGEGVGNTMGTTANEMNGTAAPAARPTSFPINIPPANSIAG
jgi:pilus assembly protein Flp/PilA